MALPKSHLALPSPSRKRRDRSANCSGDASAGAQGDGGATCKRVGGAIGEREVLEITLGRGRGRFLRSLLLVRLRLGGSGSGGRRRRRAARCVRPEQPSRVSVFSAFSLSSGGSDVRRCTPVAGGAAPGDTDNDGINADAVLGGEGAVDLGCAHALL